MTEIQNAPSILTMPVMNGNKIKEGATITVTELALDSPRTEEPPVVATCLTQSVAPAVAEVQWKIVTVRKPDGTLVKMKRRVPQAVNNESSTPVTQSSQPTKMNNNIDASKTLPISTPESAVSNTSPPAVTTTVLATASKEIIAGVPNGPTQVAPASTAAPAVVLVLHSTSEAKVAEPVKPQSPAQTAEEKKESCAPEKKDEAPKPEEKKPDTTKDAASAPTPPAPAPASAAKPATIGGVLNSVADTVNGINTGSTNILKSVQNLLNGQAPTGTPAPTTAAGATTPAGPAGANPQPAAVTPGPTVVSASNTAQAPVSTTTATNAAPGAPTPTLATIFTALSGQSTPQVNAVTAGNLQAPTSVTPNFAGLSPAPVNVAGTAPVLGNQGTVAPGTVPGLTPAPLWSIMQAGTAAIPTGTPSANTTSSPISRDTVTDHSNVTAAQEQLPGSETRLERSGNGNVNGSLQSDSHQPNASVVDRNQSTHNDPNVVHEQKGDEYHGEVVDYDPNMDQEIDEHQEGDEVIEEMGPDDVEVMDEEIGPDDVEIEEWDPEDEVIEELDLEDEIVEDEIIEEEEVVEDYTGEDEIDNLDDDLNDNCYDDHHDQGHMHVDY